MKDKTACICQVFQSAIGFVLGFGENKLRFLNSGKSTTGAVQVKGKEEEEEILDFFLLLEGIWVSFCLFCSDDRFVKGSAQHVLTDLL